MRILAFICLLILSGLTGLYSQDTGDVQVKMLSDKEMYRRSYMVI